VSEAVDRHLALQLAHEAEGTGGARIVPDADRVVARAEKYLAFLLGSSHHHKGREREPGAVEWVG
jgi:hypothetical protein